MKPEMPNGDIMYYEICYVYKVYDDLEYDNLNCQNTSDNNTVFTVQGLTAGKLIYLRFSSVAMQQGFSSLVFHMFFANV